MAHNLTRYLLLMLICASAPALASVPLVSDQWYEFYEQALMSYRQGDYAGCTARAKMAFKRHHQSGTYDIQGKAVQYFPHWLLCDSGRKQNSMDLETECHCKSEFDDSLFESCMYSGLSGRTDNAQATEEYTWRPSFSFTQEFKGATGQTGSTGLTNQNTNVVSSSSVYQVPLVLANKPVETKSEMKSPAIIKTDSEKETRDKDHTPTWKLKIKLGEDQQEEETETAETVLVYTPPKLKIDDYHRIETDKDKDAAYYHDSGKDIHRGHRVSSLDEPSAEMLIDDRTTGEDVGELLALGEVAAAGSNRRRQRADKAAQLSDETLPSKTQKSNEEGVERPRTGDPPRISVLTPRFNDEILRYQHKSADIRVDIRVTDSGTVRQVLVNGEIACQAGCRYEGNCKQSCQDKIITYHLRMNASGEQIISITAIDDSNDKATAEVPVNIRFY